LRDTGIIVGIMLSLVAGLVLLCYTCNSSSDSTPTCGIDINEIYTHKGIPVVIPDRLYLLPGATGEEEEHYESNNGSRISG
jgi:hypothetical protein